MARRRKAAQKPAENFDVVMASAPDNNTLVLTSAESIDEMYERAMRLAVSTFDPENKQYSAYLSDTQNAETLTVDRIDELSRNTQTSLSNVLTINAAVQTYINKNDLIGITYEAIESNVNTEFKCSFKKYPDKRNKSKAVDNAKAIIDDFNDQINVRRILRSAIPITYAEGTYIMYLRKKDENYVVDYYPLGVAEISDYTSNGRPVVLINIQKLKNALNKTMLKDRKRQPLFFNNQDEEIQENYPEEVYEAYKNNDTYAKLDVDHTAVIRIGNLGRKYGVSPFFRALKPVLMLETFDNADRVNAKAKAKKIIWQKMRKEIMGPQYDRKGYDMMAYAHNNFLSAWKQSTVFVTAPPSVEDIQYVEPKVEMTNIDTVNQYRSRVMGALGISFLNTDGTQTVSTANISLDQLMKNINKIAEQVEDCLKVWYRLVLAENNIDAEFVPDVKVSASEMMSMDMKKQLANFLFSTLGASYETAYTYLGLSMEDERAKRQRENENNVTEDFAPRLTAFTNSGPNGGSGSGNGNSGGGGGGAGNKSGVTNPEDDGKKIGRPQGDATDKQAYDKARNDAKKQIQGKG